MWYEPFEKHTWACLPLMLSSSGYLNWIKTLLKVVLLTPPEFCSCYVELLWDCKGSRWALTKFVDVILYKVNKLLVTFGLLKLDMKRVANGSDSDPLNRVHLEQVKRQVHGDVFEFLNNWNILDRWYSDVFCLLFLVSTLLKCNIIPKNRLSERVSEWAPLRDCILWLSVLGLGILGFSVLRLPINRLTIDGFSKWASATISVISSDLGMT
jgi:hypothetical protein